MAEFNSHIGLTLGEYGLLSGSYGPKENDITISWGLGLYVIFGVGLEASFNLTEFSEVWQSEW